MLGTASPSAVNLKVWMEMECVSRVQGQGSQSGLSSGGAATVQRSCFQVELGPFVYHLCCMNGLPVTCLNWYKFSCV